MPAEAGARWGGGGAAGPRCTCALGSVAAQLLAAPSLKRFAGRHCERWQEPVWRCSDLALGCRPSSRRWVRRAASFLRRAFALRPNAKQRRLGDRKARRGRSRAESVERVFDFCLSSRQPEASRARGTTSWPSAQQQGLQHLLKPVRAWGPSPVAVARQGRRSEQRRDERHGLHRPAGAKQARQHRLSCRRAQRPPQQSCAPGLAHPQQPATSHRAAPRSSHLRRATRGRSPAACPTRPRQGTARTRSCSRWRRRWSGGSCAPRGGSLRRITRRHRGGATPLQPCGPSIALR